MVGDLTHSRWVHSPSLLIGRGIVVSGRPVIIGGGLSQFISEGPVIVMEGGHRSQWRNCRRNWSLSLSRCHACMFHHLVTPPLHPLTINNYYTLLH